MPSAAKLLAREPTLADYLAEIPSATAPRSRPSSAGSSKEASKPRDSTALTRLRFEWIRLVGLVLGNLEASRASKEAIATLRGPVLEASERAGKRYAAEAATTEEDAAEAAPGSTAAGTAETG